MGTSGAFIAVCVAAIAKGGPALLATLVVISSVVPVRAGGAAVPAAQDSHADGGGNGDHADRGHGHADRVRHADPGARGCATAGGAGERPGHGAGHYRAGPEGDRSATPLGAGDRRRRRFAGGSVIRPVRRRRRWAGGMGRHSQHRVARPRPELWAPVLGAVAVVRVRDPGRRHRDDRRRRGNPARVVAPAAGRRLPRGAGRGGRGRRRQPAFRSRRHGTEHHLFHQHRGNRADRRRRARRRSRHRCHLRSAGLPAQGARGGAGDSAPGGGSVHHRAPGHALRHRDEDGDPGWDRLSQGLGGRGLFLGRGGVPKWRDLSRVLRRVRRRPAAERHDCRRAWWRF